MPRIKDELFVTQCHRCRGYIMSGPCLKGLSAVSQEPLGFVISSFQTCGNSALWDTVE